LKEHDEGFGPATAIATTRLASTLLAAGQPQEAQVGLLLLPPLAVMPPRKLVVSAGQRRVDAHAVACCCVWEAGNRFGCGSAQVKSAIP
jgi:hypothetical protein